MKNLKLNLIAAVCENMGIGNRGDLPWILRNELKHFSRTTKSTNNPAKRNAVIMGRKTFFSIPEDKRPLSGRINIVLTKDPDRYRFPADVIVVTSLDEALKRVQDPEFDDEIENVWIVGGYSVYKEAMESPLCHRIYLTRVMAKFECDAFFPELTDDFKRVKNEPDMTEEIQQENGLRYQYQTYEKCHK